jgi:hypothetical protein
MIDEVGLGREFFEGLERVDAEVVAAVAMAGCAKCGGRLHRADYPRKPRGGGLAAAGEFFRSRFSLCCGREGCRRRATPPSVRFLGRRVYLGAAVIVGSVIALALATAATVQRATGIPAKTTRRWLRWWRGPFTATSVFLGLAGRMVPAVARLELPRSLLDRLPGVGRVQRLLVWLAPLTTMSIADGARFVRGTM